MTADAKRASLVENKRQEIFEKLSSPEERGAVLERFAELESRSAATSSEFGDARINKRDGASVVESQLRMLAVEYLTGVKTAADFDGKKKEILKANKVTDVIDNTLEVLDGIRGSRPLSREAADVAVRSLDFGIWNEASAAGETLRKGLGDRLVALCHGSRILGTTPAIAAATAVSVALYLVKGGFGTRQLAVGAATGMATSFAVVGAIAAAPVLTGVVVGTAVASVFSYLRKGKEVKKDLNQVRTEKVLGQHRTDEKLSRKDQKFRENFMNSRAINVRDQISKLTDPEVARDKDRLAKLIGQTEAALELQNDVKQRANSLDYSDPTTTAKERLELIRALVKARGSLAEDDVLKTKRETANADFRKVFLDTEESVNKEFGAYRRSQQRKAFVTTMLVGSTMGGLFYGAGRAVEAIQEHWSQAHPVVGGSSVASVSPQGSATSTGASAAAETPQVSGVQPSGLQSQPGIGPAPTAATEILRQSVTTPPSFDVTNPPVGVSFDPATGEVIVNSASVDPDVLAELQRYQPAFSTQTLREAIQPQDVRMSITDGITGAHSSGAVHGGTLVREYHYDNATSAFDKNELRLNWGGAGRRGVDSDGNIVYNIKRMFKEDSFYVKGGTKISLDVGDAVRHGASTSVEPGRLELLLRLDAAHPDQVIRVPIQSDGSIVIPEEVKQAAYRVNAAGAAEYLGWKASIGLVQENNGQISFGEIATDFGSRKLNGATVQDTIAGKEAVVEYHFPKVEQIKEQVVQKVVPAPQSPVEPVVPPQPVPVDPVVPPNDDLPTPVPTPTVTPQPHRVWVFPTAWDDHRDALGNNRSNGDLVVAAAPKVSQDEDENKRGPSVDGKGKSLELLKVQNEEQENAETFDWKTVSPTDDLEARRLATLHNLEQVLKANPKRLLKPESNEPWYLRDGEIRSVGTDMPPDSELFPNLKPGVAALLKNSAGDFLGIACIAHPEKENESLLVLVDPREFAPSYFFDRPDQLKRMRPLRDWFASSIERTYYTYVPDEKTGGASESAESAPDKTPAKKRKAPSKDAVKDGAASNRASDAPQEASQTPAKPKVVVDSNPEVFPPPPSAKKSPGRRKGQARQRGNPPASGADSTIDV